MSFYDIDKTEEFLLSLLPQKADAEFADVLDQCEKLFVPVISATGAQLLKIITALVRPEKIIEIGTGIGYSGLIMLSASNAKLHTIDFNERNLAFARESFRRYGYEKRVELLHGDASGLVPMLSGKTDLIFMDGPKGRYYEYYPYLVKLLRPGGVLICDNVLYSGRITGENETPAAKHTITERLGLFFDLIKNDETVMTSVLPIGDGMSVSYKL